MTNQQTRLYNTLYLHVSVVVVVVGWCGVGGRSQNKDLMFDKHHTHSHLPSVNTGKDTDKRQPRCCES